MNCSYIMLCCCVVSLYFVHNAVAAPTALEVRLFSQFTGQYVRFTEGRRITADGTEESAAAFYTHIINNLITIELVDEPGKFLILTDKVSNSTNSTVLLNSPPSQSQYELVVGIPFNDSYIQWEMMSASSYALKQTLDPDTDCFVAFNNDGSVAGPCNLSQDDPATRTLIVSAV